MIIRGNGFVIFQTSQQINKISWSDVVKLKYDCNLQLKRIEWQDIYVNRLLIILHNIWYNTSIWNVEHTYTHRKYIHRHRVLYSILLLYEYIVMKKVCINTIFVSFLLNDENSNMYWVGRWHDCFTYHIQKWETRAHSTVYEPCAWLSIFSHS